MGTGGIVNGTFAPVQSVQLKGGGRGFHIRVGNQHTDSSVRSEPISSLHLDFEVPSESHLEKKDSSTLSFLRLNRKGFLRIARVV